MITAPETSRAPLSPMSTSEGSAPAATASTLDSAQALGRALGSAALSAVAPSAPSGASSTVEASDAPSAEELGLFAGALGLTSDPLSFLLALQTEMASQQTELQRSDVQISTQAQQQSIEAQREARQRSERAARRAGRWLGHAPKWVKKLVEGVTIAAGVAGAAFTGGASLGLAIAGAVLMLSASGFEKLAVKLGMSPEKARWVGFACAAAGAALSMGAGAAGGGASAASASTTAASASTSAVSAASATAAATTAASTGTQVAQMTRLITQITRLVQSGMQVTEGTRLSGAAVLGAQAADARIAVERRGNEVEASQAHVEEVLVSMRDSLSALRDVRSRVLAMAELESRRAEATVERIGR